MIYPVVIVPVGTASQLEQLGTKSKFWFKDSKGEGDVLFKEGRPGTGENWAEKVCCEVCDLLELPHAFYDFAECHDREGVITPTFVSKISRLIHGNELLAHYIKDYEEGKRFKVRQHTVKIVMTVLGDPEVKLPKGWNSSEKIESAADVFVGYLMLDALVSNQDRHHENWGLIVTNSSVSLAPSFDHASSLGRNETDKGRIERLDTKDQGRNVETYVKRAKSAFYESSSSSKPLSTIEAFTTAAKIRPIAGQYWLEKLEMIRTGQYETIFSNIPEAKITEPAIRFALQMLDLNAKRLLDHGN